MGLWHSIMENNLLENNHVKEHLENARSLLLIKGGEEDKASGAEDKIPPFKSIS